MISPTYRAEAIYSDPAEWVDALVDAEEVEALVDRATALMTRVDRDMAEYRARGRTYLFFAIVCFLLDATALLLSFRYRSLDHHLQFAIYYTAIIVPFFFLYLWFELWLEENALSRFRGDLDTTQRDTFRRIGWERT